MVDGGKPIHHLERVMESYPLIQHGVSLGIGGPDYDLSPVLEWLAWRDAKNG